MTGDLVVRGGVLLTTEGRVRADLVIADGRISSWRPSRPDDALTDARTIDATDLVVAPGLIDLQCNGAGGIDLTAEPERLWEVAAILPRWGATAWLPTIVSSPPDIRQRALATIGNPPTESPQDGGGAGSVGSAGSASASPQEGGRLRGHGGPIPATPLGLHFEGPFLALERRGAHGPAHLAPPDLALIDGWSAKSGVAMATVAPELPGALDVIAALVDQDVVVSLGHSSATAAQASAAVDLGARAVTHVFSAMTPLHHREPGLIGVALTDARLTVGMIVDGVHVHPSVVDLAARALGTRLALVTDAVAALGAPASGARSGTSPPAVGTDVAERAAIHGRSGAPGRRVRLGDIEAVADDHAVRLADGTLAGSVLSLDRAVANLMAFAGLGLDQAVQAATETPARLLALTGDRGHITPGAAGDVVLLDTTGDRLEVVATVIHGEVAYDRGVTAPAPGDQR
ncbi:MAG: N-acetylglucosamine-6-phosphate deacetylase [Acidimicrobiales bacterium]